MVNEITASTSEIVAGALQAWKRAPLVGTTTFGKGTEHRYFELHTGGVLRLTTGENFLATNTSKKTKISLNKVGLIPDVIVENPEDLDESNEQQEFVDPERDPQLKKAIELLQNQTK